MAHMIPDVVPAPGPGRRAERALYEALRTGLSDEFFVYHGLNYLERRRAEEGEVDFLLVHRELGILVLECKGRGVRRSGVGRWVRETADGREVPIESPFQQAQRQIKALVRELETRIDPFFGAGLPFVHGHAAAFPLAEVRDGSLPLEAQREIVLLEDDLAHVSNWVEGAFRFWKRAAHSVRAPLSPSEFTRFRRQVLHPKLDLVETLGSRMHAEDAEIARLTDEQLKTLRGCMSSPRVRIAGSAGTGKTVLALEAARRYADRGAGRVLVVCYNKALAADLAARVASWERPGGGTIEVLTFHALCRKAYEALDRSYEPPPASESERSKRFWNEEAPTTLLEAIHLEKLARFDAIVVDEAQDFHEDWTSVLEDCLRDRALGTLAIFFDPAQAIFGRKTGLSTAARPMELAINFRNTRAIAEVVRKLGAVEMESHARCPAGEDPVVHAHESPKKTLEQIEGLITRLLGKEGVRPEQITLLTPHTRANSTLRDVTALGGVELASSVDDRAGKLLHTTIAAFKGLESDVVLLIDLDPGDERSSRMARYVAASRAKHVLHVWTKRDWTGP
jgi:hypothetical protein